MPEGTNISAHINSLKDIAVQLAGVGVQITDQEFVMVLLGSLPDSYSGLVMALESQQVELKLPFMQQCLMHEEAQRKDISLKVSLKADSSGEDSEEVAFVASGTPMLNKDRFCSFCSSRTHVKKKCFKLKKLRHSAQMMMPPQHNLEGEGHITSFAHHMW